MLNATPVVAFVPADRWFEAASGLAGPRGTSVSLTWSIVRDGTMVRSRGPSQLIALLDASFHVDDGSGELTERSWFGLLANSFERWGELGGVEFVYEPYDDGATHGQTPGELGVRGDIRIGGSLNDGPGGTLAFSQFPDGAEVGLDIEDLPFLLSPTADFRHFRNVLMHEIGHAIGLDHLVSSDAAFLMEPKADELFDGPQIDDIRGLHHLYGDRFEKASGSAGNNSTATATDIGLLSASAPITLGVDGGVGTSVEPTHADFLSITGALNPDFYAFEIQGPSYLEVVLEPLGGRYHQAVEGGTELLTDAFSSSNLAFSVLAVDATPLVEVNGQPAGGVEMIHNLLLPAGKYFLEVSGSREVAQLYKLRLSIQLTKVPEPPTAHVAALLAATTCGSVRRRRRGITPAEFL